MLGGQGAGGYGYVAGNLNVPAAGSKVYGGTIPQSVYVTPNQAAATPVITTLQSVDDYLGAGPRALTTTIDTGAHAVADPVVAAAGAVMSVGQWLLIGVLVVGAIVLVPYVSRETRS